MAEKYKAPIGNIPAAILKLLANIARAFTEKITHAPSKKIVDGTIDNFKNLITALSDANPEDEAQIREIVNQMLTAGEFYEGSRESILLNIQKVKNENLRNALILALDNTYIVGATLTDEIEDDGEQLEALLQEFLGSPEGVEFLNYLLKLVVDPSTANLIALILIEALKGIITDDRQEALAILQTKLQTEVFAEAA